MEAIFTNMFINTIRTFNCDKITNNIINTLAIMTPPNFLKN